MYKVVVRFKDLQDNGHLYNVGDNFPRSGKEVTPSRIRELSTNKNKRGVVLIVEEISKEGLSEAKEDTQEPKTASKPSNRSEAKRRPRKG